MHSITNVTRQYTFLSFFMITYISTPITEELTTSVQYHKNHTAKYFPFFFHDSIELYPDHRGTHYMHEVSQISTCNIFSFLFPSQHIAIPDDNDHNNRLFLVPHLVRAQSDYKDVRICSFHHTHTHIHTHAHTHTHTHTHTQHTYTHQDACAHPASHTHAHTYACMHTCTHARTHARMHTHTHTHYKYMHYQ